MKRISYLLVLFVALALSLSTPLLAKPSDNVGQIEQGNPAQTGPSAGKNCLWKKIKAWKAKKDEKNAALLEKLVLIAKKDLEMSLTTMSGKDKCFKAIVPAVGHLNHALKALKDGKPPRHLKKAYKHLTKRISHAKFYVVTYNFDEASQRVQSALDVIGEL